MNACIIVILRFINFQQESHYEGKSSLLKQSDSEEDFDDVEDIYIEPLAAWGDEDSANERNNFGSKTDNLSGGQLQSGAEAALRKGKRIRGQNDDHQHPWNEKTSGRQSLPKKKAKKNIHWEKNIIYENENIFPESNHAMFRGQKPYQVFE